MPNPTAEESMLFDELIDGVLGAGDHASFSRTGSSNGSGLMPATLSRGGSTTGSGHMSIEAARFSFSRPPARPGATSPSL